MVIIPRRASILLEVSNIYTSRYGGCGKSCLIVPYEAIRHLKNFFVTGLLEHRLRALEWAEMRFLKKKVGSSALKKRSAIQRISISLGKRGYFGLSNSQIAKLIGASRSTANRIKLKSIKHEYLYAFKKSRLVCKLDSVDMNIKKYAPNPERFFITKDSSGGLILMERLTDEIITSLRWVKRNSYKK